MAEIEGQCNALKFDNTDLKRKLESESDDLRQTKRVISEMKQRIQELEDLRRSEEQHRIKFLEEQAIVKDKMDVKVTNLSEALNNEKASKMSEIERLRRDNHERERKLRQESIQWEKLIQAHLNECFNPGSGDPATLSLEEEIKRQEIEYSSHMTENGSSLNNMFPRRHIIQQLGQIRRLRNAFKQTVQHAEAKYIGKMENMSMAMQSIQSRAAAMSKKISKLSTKIMDAEKLKMAMNILESDRKDEKAELKKELTLKTRLEGKVELLEKEIVQAKSQYQEKSKRLKDYEQKFNDLNITAREMQTMKSQLVETKDENAKLKDIASTLRISNKEQIEENSRLKDAIGMAQKEMDTLYQTQRKLHQQINDRDHELKRYSHELHGRLANTYAGSENQQHRFHGVDESRYNTDIRLNRAGARKSGNVLGMSARDMILKQVEDTHHLIRNSKSVLEAERRRYLETSAAKPPPMYDRPLDIGHLDDVDNIAGRLSQLLESINLTVPYITKIRRNIHLLKDKRET